MSRFNDWVLGAVERVAGPLAEWMIRGGPQHDPLSRWLREKTIIDEKLSGDGCADTDPPRPLD
jgi:hypothetical protein